MTEAEAVRRYRAILKKQVTFDPGANHEPMTDDEASELYHRELRHPQGAGTRTKGQPTRKTPEGLGRLLTVAQAAEILGVKRATMYEWTYGRRIATVRFGRTVRIRESDVRALIERNLHPAID